MRRPAKRVSEHQQDSHTTIDFLWTGGKPPQSLRRRWMDEDYGSCWITMKAYMDCIYHSPVPIFLSTLTSLPCHVLIPSSLTSPGSGFSCPCSLPVPVHRRQPGGMCESYGLGFRKLSYQDRFGVHYQSFELSSLRLAAQCRRVRSEDQVKWPL